MLLTIICFIGMKSALWRTRSKIFWRWGLMKASSAGRKGQAHQVVRGTISSLMAPTCYCSPLQKPHSSISLCQSCSSSNRAGQPTSDWFPAQTSESFEPSKLQRWNVAEVEMFRVLGFLTNIVFCRHMAGSWNTFTAQTLFIQSVMHFGFCKQRSKP